MGIMNRDCIKANKTAFEYWLETGKKLWFRANVGLNWQLIEPLFNVKTHQYLIADEFAEFRKAMADGKHVQRICQCSACLLDENPSILVKKLDSEHFFRGKAANYNVITRIPKWTQNLSKENSKICRVWDDADVDAGAYIYSTYKEVISYVPSDKEPFKTDSGSSWERAEPVNQVWDKEEDVC